VKKIEIHDKSVKSIVLEDGSQLSADLIVANADLPYVYRKLLPDKGPADRLERKKYTCSAIMFYWGVDKVYPQLDMHNLFVAGDFRHSMDRVFRDNSLPDEPNFYIHAPTRTDPSAAPPGQDTLMVLVPCGRVEDKNNQDWRAMLSLARHAVFQRLGEFGMTDLKEHLKFEVSYSPHSWIKMYNLAEGLIPIMSSSNNDSSAILARSITRSGSIQTYFTARLMVDKDLVDDFFRAYAYFRWIDDVIDISSRSDEERLRFISNQRRLIDSLYDQEPVVELTPEEEILKDLINNDRGENSGLQSFIRNMFAIIEFDAQRKGRLISESELDWYVKTLGRSVTDGLLYFIGNGNPYPESENRYQAGIAAHISHLLRDMHQDNADGFINIPREYLEANRLSHEDMNDPAYKDWVRQRVELAQELFAEGKSYLDGIGVLRAKIVGYWYCARFEVVLDTIEGDEYLLREEYHERRRVSTWLKIIWLGISLSFRHFFRQNKLKSSAAADNSRIKSLVRKQ
jgi:phytoene/squalene synthetase